MSHLDLSTAYLIVRDLDVSGAPVVAAGWSAVVQGDTGWYTVTRDADHTVIAAWKANAVASRGLFAMFAPRSVLEAVAASEPMCMPAREAWARVTEPTIRAYLRYWPVWRIDGHVRDDAGIAQPVTNTVIRLVPAGVQLPDPSVTPLPWLLRTNGTLTAVQAEAAVRVAVIHRPALQITIGGYPLHASFEDEAPR